MSLDPWLIGVSVVFIGLSLAFVAWRSIFRSRLSVERLWRVSLTQSMITVTDRRGNTRALPLKDVVAIYVRTTDEGPWTPDVWFGLKSSENEAPLEFPMGSIGEQETLDWMLTLPGFEFKGMDSAENAVFVCWTRSDAPT